MNNKNIFSIIILLAIINQFGVASGNSTTAVELEIHELEILNDHDFGSSGEIFITIQINGKDQNRVPNDNGHRSMDNGDIWYPNFKNTYDLTSGDVLTVEIREDDEADDESIGKVNFDLNSPNISRKKYTNSDFNIIISFRKINGTITSDTPQDSLSSIPSENTSKPTTDAPINMTSILTGLVTTIVLSRKINLSN